MEVYKLCEICADDLSCNQETVEIEPQHGITSPDVENKSALELENDNIDINQIDKDEFLNKNEPTKKDNGETKHVSFKEKAVKPETEVRHHVLDGIKPVDGISQYGIGQSDLNTLGYVFNERGQLTRLADGRLFSNENLVAFEVFLKKAFQKGDSSYKAALDLGAKDWGLNKEWPSHQRYRRK